MRKARFRFVLSVLLTLILSCSSLLGATRVYAEELMDGVIETEVVLAEAETEEAYVESEVDAEDYAEPEAELEPYVEAEVETEAEAYVESELEVEPEPEFAAEEALEAEPVADEVEAIAEAESAADEAPEGVKTTSDEAETPAAVAAEPDDEGSEVEVDTETDDSEAAVATEEATRAETATCALPVAARSLPEPEPTSHVGSFEIKKTVDGTEIPISGVGFELRRQDGGEIVEGKTVIILTTDAMGEAQIDGLADGDYIATEVSVPDWIEPEANSFEFTIDSDANIASWRLSNRPWYSDVVAAKGWMLGEYEGKVDVPLIYLQLSRSIEGGEMELIGGPVALEPVKTQWAYYVWSNLPSFDNYGNDYYYSVAEVDESGNAFVPEGYKMEKETLMTIINTLVFIPTPEDPGTPENPDDPGTPENPDDPGTPENPDNPDNPGEPGEPGTPDTPENPDDPGTPENPDTPVTPEDPETPGTPGAPSTPTTPAQSTETPAETATTPSESSTSTATVETPAGNTAVAAAANTDVPHTGDVNVFGAVASLVALGAVSAFTGWLAYQHSKKENE